MPAEPTEPLLRVALDASALLGSQRGPLLVAARLQYYAGYWSSWIVGEVVRKRTEWAAERARRTGADQAELSRRLRESREHVNLLVQQVSELLQSVDYTRAVPADLSWLRDHDDWPVMQTALAARADVLVTDNSHDFPPGEVRNGVLLLGSRAFLERLYARFPEAEEALRTYSLREGG